MNDANTDTNFPSVSSNVSFWLAHLRDLTMCVPALHNFCTVIFRKQLIGNLTPTEVDEEIIAYVLKRRQELLNILKMPAGLLGSEKLRSVLDYALVCQSQMFAKVRSPVCDSKVKPILDKISEEISQLWYIIDFGRKIVRAAQIIRLIYEHDPPNKTELINDVLDIWEDLSLAESGPPQKYERAWLELCNNKPLLESMLDDESEE